MQCPPPPPRFVWYFGRAHLDPVFDGGARGEQLQELGQRRASRRRAPWVFNPEHLEELSERERENR